MHFQKNHYYHLLQKECKDIYQDSMKVDSAANNCRFKLQEYDEKQSVSEINDIINQRKSIKRDSSVKEKGNNNRQQVQQDERGI